MQLLGPGPQELAGKPSEVVLRGAVTQLLLLPLFTWGLGNGKSSQRLGSLTTVGLNCHCCGHTIKNRKKRKKKSLLPASFLSTSNCPQVFLLAVPVNKLAKKSGKCTLQSLSPRILGKSQKGGMVPKDLWAPLGGWVPQKPEPETKP